MRKYERMRNARDCIFMDIGGFLSSLGVVFGDLAYKTDASASTKDEVIISLRVTIQEDKDEPDIMLNLTYDDNFDFISSLNILSQLPPNHYRFIQHVYNIRFGDYTKIHTI